MGFMDTVFKGVSAGRDNAKEDWGYNVLENTPILHGSDQLRTMSKHANKDQKASIYKHMVNHDVVDEQYEGYYKLSRELWDDFS